MCVSSTLFPGSPSNLGPAMAKAEFSEEEEEADQKYTSAKVDQIQYLSFSPENMRHCVVVSQRVHSGRRQDGDLVQEDDSDSVERRRHQKPSVANQCISHSNTSPSSSSSIEKFNEREYACLFRVSAVAKPHFLLALCFDNTPAACSSTLIRSSSLCDVKTTQSISSATARISAWCLMSSMRNAAKLTEVVPSPI